jgi:uncharacterized protein (DUF1499 family)
LFDLLANLPSLLLASASGTNSQGGAVGRDLTAVSRSRWPNDALIGPARGSGPTADAVAPEFAVDSGRLFDLVRELVAQLPRTQIVAADREAGAIVARSRSRLLGFVDEVRVQVLPLGDTHSTLALYGRARTGLWDLGVNRRRLMRMVALLEAALPRAGT